MTFRLITAIAGLLMLCAFNALIVGRLLPDTWWGITILMVWSFGSGLGYAALVPLNWIIRGDR